MYSTNIYWELFIWTFSIHFEFISEVNHLQWKCPLISKSHFFKNKDISNNKNNIVPFKNNSYWISVTPVDSFSSDGGKKIEQNLELSEYFATEIRTFTCLKSLILFYILDVNLYQVLYFLFFILNTLSVILSSSFRL